MCNYTDRNTSTLDNIIKSPNEKIYIIWWVVQDSNLFPSDYLYPDFGSSSVQSFPMEGTTQEIYSNFEAISFAF